MLLGVVKEVLKESKYSHFFAFALLELSPVLSFLEISLYYFFVKVEPTLITVILSITLEDNLQNYNRITHPLY